ncbi:MAG: hypothetical protein HC911_09860 [Chloroflexaceae bacterium]|nr:hypothetical protein [Chloroflexaceae bacterium]
MIPTLPRFWRLIIPPLLVGAILRVLWLLIWPRPLIYDEMDYHNLALRLLSGEGYGVQLFPPGWPLILSYLYRITVPDSMIGLGFNVLLSLVTLVLIAGLALRLADHTTAAISAWIVALMPSYLVANTLLMYEVWAQFLLVLAVWLTLHRTTTMHDMVALAAITALLALVRPFWLVLPLVLWLAAPPPHQPRHSLIMMLMAQTMAVLLVLPYMVVLSRTYGAFVPLGLNGNVNFWIGNNPQATGTFMPPPYGYWITLSAQARDATLLYLQEHPMHFFRLLPLKLYHLLGYEAYTGDWVFLQAAHNDAFDPHFLATIDWVLNIPYWIISGLAGLGLTLALAHRHTLGRLWLLFGFNIATYLIFFGVPRFRWTLQFVMILSAAYALRWLVAMWQQRHPPSVARLAAWRRMRL